ncbi:MAG: hypothetical protein K2P85_04150 [Flavobacteriaceae bacterium]|nr:hypothetical protein [Flavobacteriaceae bacterium]
MKKVLLVLSLFVFSQMVGQKKYSFDYIFLIEHTDSLKNIKTNSLYWLSSRHNNYRLYASGNKDSLAYAVLFVDENGISFNRLIAKTKLNKIDTITNTCDEVNRFGNPYKFEKRNYSFINLKDTLINDTIYYHYILKSKKPLKYQKRKKIDTVHYIVDKTDPDFLPFTYHSMIYEIWKASKNVPNGYPKYIYCINTEGKETGRVEFKKAKRINRCTIIPNDCDYTKEEIRNRNSAFGFILH